MIEVIDRRQEGKLKEHGPMIAVVVLFATVVLLGFLSVVAVLATPPLQDEFKTSGFAITNLGTVALPIGAGHSQQFCALRMPVKL